MCVNIRSSYITQDAIIAFKEVSKQEDGKFFSFYWPPARSTQHGIDRISSTTHQCGTHVEYEVGATMEDLVGVGFYAYLYGEKVTKDMLQGTDPSLEYYRGSKSITVLAIRIPVGTPVHQGVDMFNSASIIAKKIEVLGECKYGSQIDVGED